MRKSASFFSSQVQLAKERLHPSGHLLHTLEAPLFNLPPQKGVPCGKNSTVLDYSNRTFYLSSAASSLDASMITLQGLRFGQIGYFHSICLIITEDIQADLLDCC